MRVVTRDGKEYEQTVVLEEDDYPILHALAKKQNWLRETVGSKTAPVSFHRLDDLGEPVVTAQAQSH